MAAQTRLFLCLTDNYGVLLHDPESGATAAIDAPEAAPVEAALKASGWRLTDILVTHHHADHTGGIAELKQRHRCRVVAPHGEAARIPLVDATVREDDEVRVGSLKGRVLETPGHTAGHISYFFPRGLPDDARIYCGHEYTKANVRFAKTIEPANAALNAREREVDKLLAAGEPTVPSTMGAEKAANPFLRADVPEVAKSVGLAGSPAWKVFAEIRERKNRS
jgi:hydroxyacylglutathione hydrolase